MSDRIGWIGAGEMGRPMIGSLARAGFTVIVFDIDSSRIKDLPATPSLGGLLAESDIVCTTLPSSDAWVKVAEQDLVPNARQGQLFIDFGTAVPSDARRIGEHLNSKGARLLDCPMSGGAWGAENADLFLFAGGQPEDFERAKPLLHAVGGGEHTTYCGPSGCGQVLKAVNQLMMGLGSAAFLEAISFGINSGVPAEKVYEALAGPGRYRGPFTETAKMVAEGKGIHEGVKFRELPYFLLEAEQAGFPLPLTQTLYRFLENAERVTVDDHRQAPSFFHELTR